MYGLLAFALRASNAPDDVARFLYVILALFGLHLFVWWRARTHTVTVVWILLFAAAFRLTMLAVGLPQENRIRALQHDLGGERTGYQPFLLYDNDIWRYLWDGHLSATGIGPYAATPHELLTEVEESGEDQPPLDSDLWWDVLDNVSFRTYTSVYPPLAQEVFSLAHFLAPGSVLVLKFLILLIDLGSCLAVVALLRALGRPDRDLLLYAWSPLVIKEFAGSGHLDTLMILLISWAAVALIRRRDWLAQSLLGIAVAAKLGALILFPLFWMRTRPKTWVAAPIAGLAVSVPFLSGIDGLFRGLGTYAREWDFNSGIWQALATSFGVLGLEDPGGLAHLLVKGATLAVVAGALLLARRGELQWVHGCFLTLAGLVILNPAVMPWYIPWALPFAIAVGNRTWIAFSGVAFLSYLFYVDQGAATWWLWVEYLVVLGVAVWELSSRSRRPESLLASEP